MAPIIENLRKRASDTLDQLADRERQRTPGLTREAAIAKALDTPEGAEAYALYDEGVTRGDPARARRDEEPGGTAVPLDPRS